MTHKTGYAIKDTDLHVFVLNVIHGNIQFRRAISQLHFTAHFNGIGHFVFKLKILATTARPSLALLLRASKLPDFAPRVTVA